MIDIILVCKTLLILALAIISPGPDFFVILRTSLVYGRKAGFFCALGIATGCLISFPILIGGLRFLFLYKTTQILLSIVCGLYLMYLGYKSITHQSRHHQMQFKQKHSESMIIYFKNGLFTNILNPKLYTISGAILTFVEQNNPTLMTNAAIIIGNALLALIWFCFTVFLLSHTRTQKLYFKQERLINRLLGCVLILIGLRIIWTLRKLI